MALSSCKIIVECGNNHIGDLAIARKMIDVAVEAGADIVKFQTYKTEKLTGLTPDILKYLKRAELNYLDHIELIDYCGDRIEFLSSAFDLESIKLLKKLGLKKLKIPSGQASNVEYLLAAGVFDKVIVSTGMMYLIQVAKTIDILTWTPISEIILLHCVSSYPAPMEDVNLQAMKTMAEQFGLPVGLSDHTLGIEVPIAAAALGAVMIEKHFTLDRTMVGPDQAMSIEPDELKQMVKAIRNVEKAMGDGVKQCMKSEQITLGRKQ